MIGNLSFDRLTELKGKGYRLQEVGLPTLANISFPGTFMTKGPTSDIRVRQAMSYAINRQEICDTFYKGLAKPGGFWFFSTQTWGFHPATFKSDPFDPAKAKQLWQDLMHYGYDPMWINVELVEVPTYFAVGPNVGAFTNRSWINLWDSYLGIQHKA